MTPFIKLIHFPFQPSRLLVASFALIIFLGGLLLRLPMATPPPHISFLDALFTATSATCVTGLTVLDTPSSFTPFGKAVILGLIQAGGLGIMTFSFLPFILLDRPMPFRGRMVMYETHLLADAGLHPERLILFLFGSTFLVESLGATMLYLRLLAHADIAKNDPEWFIAIFHAVSAYCNAGFALLPDNLASFKNDPVFVITHALLIITGGIGFLVLYEIRKWLMGRGARGRRKVSLHTKIVLSVTATLLLSGAVFYAVFEWTNTLSGLSLGDRLINSFFHAVTPRTAGFNTLDMAAMRPITVYIVIFLMFLGASPGSTGGGIKTTTVGILVGFMRSLLKGEYNVSLFGRAIPGLTLRRALAVCIVAQVFIGGCFFGLLCVPLDPRAPLGHHGAFVAYLFELVSAFGTVGLSLGITPWLHPLAKGIIILAMFVGRVGPLTLVMSIGRKEEAALYALPEEDVMVG